MTTKYRTGKIYMIYSLDNDIEPYYGSTYKTLKNRKDEHEYSYKYFLEGKPYSYCSSFKIIKLGNWDMKLVVDYPCENRTELERSLVHSFNSLKNCPV